MRPDDTSPNQEWLPQPLPEDDDLARAPDVVDAAALADPLGPADPLGSADPLGPAGASVPAAADAPSPTDAPPTDAPSVAATPRPTDAPPTDAPSGAATSPPVIDDDAPLPADLQLIRAEVAPEPKGRSWAGVFVVAAFAPFFVTAPLVVMGGNPIVWMLAYLAGATLMVTGGVATSRTLLTRGTGRLLPLLALVVGVLTVLGCAAAAVVGAG